MPVVCPNEAKARADPEAWFRRQPPSLGKDVAFYPADHELTKRAEALRDEFLATAQAEIEQQHGGESAAAAHLRRRLAAGPPAVRVFSCSAEYVGGRCGPGSIVVSDSESSMSWTMAHEVAHYTLQHGSERNAVIRHARGLVQSELQAQPSAGDCPLWHLRPETAGGALQGEERLPLLMPGDPAFDLPTRQALASRKMCTELEAEQVALLLFARTGRNLCMYIAGKAAVCRAGLLLGAIIWPTDRLCRALDDAAQAAEACSPGSLTAITASDSGGGGRYLWPNEAKQLQNFARHLPAAMAVCEAHRPAPKAPWASWLCARLPGLC
ncbi:hypothetical protein ABPG75_010233 [Micractinium tetrahymenae]